jgi:hypothetical protein
MNEIEYLLDTNIIIGILKGYVPAIALAKEVELTLNKAAISQITRLELLSYSKLTNLEEQEIRAFLSNCQVFPLDDMIEIEAIRLRKKDNLKLPDAIVAATAIVKKLRLLTLDQKMLNKYVLN